MSAYTGGLPGLSVRRPWLAVVANILIIIAGIGALFGVEVRELPAVDRPVVSVRATYPGASPTTIDAEVTSVVEGAVARVAGVTSVRSSSGAGSFWMHVELDSLRDITDAATDVREAVSRIVPQLPDGVDDLLVVKSDPDAGPIIKIAVTSGELPVDVLTRRIKEEVVPELTAVDGVAEVRLSGERERVIRVAVSPERLAAHGVSISEVSDVLRAAQFDVPVGSFGTGQREVLVRADATVTQPERIEKLQIRPNLQLGSVAEVYSSLATPESFSRLDGRLVVTMGVVRQAQSNTLQISRNVGAVLSRLSDRFPELDFTVVDNDALFIEGAIREVLWALAVVLAVVVAVMWLFMGRLGATLIPTVAIPVALIGSVAGIWAMGFSINLITLLALVLATGIIVDDAIVVTENVQRRRADGLGRRAAAVIGTRQVFFAVIATTATLIAVFVPISFMPGEADQLFAEFGFVLALTVTFSSFVALSLCPAIASLMPKLGDEQGLTGPLGGWLAAIYHMLLRLVMTAPLVTIAASAALAAGAVVIYDDLGEELTPSEDRGAVTVRLWAPVGMGLDYTDRQVEQVEAMLQPWVERGLIEEIYSITGLWGPNSGEVGARLQPWSERTVSQAQIAGDLRSQFRDIAGASAWVARYNSLGLRDGSGSGLKIALTGPTYPAIAEAAETFAMEMERMPGLSNIRVHYEATQPQLSIDIDRGRAADLGVPMDELSATLHALIDENEVGELTVDDRAIPVILQSTAGDVRDPMDLLNLNVRASDGVLVPLIQLVSFAEHGVAAELDRHGQRRAIEVSAAVSPEVTLAEVVDRLRAIGGERLEPGIGLLFLGEAASLEETSAALVATYVIALLVVFLVLVAQFESLTSALVVILTVPFGVSAAIYALWLTGTTVNIFSQIGVLMLIGIMAKNGILLVEFADQLRDRGAPVWEAAAQAATARLRPIAMTLISTALAGLPLILSSGPGAEARAAIGWVIFGGLGLSTLYTLCLTPALYTVIAGLSRPRASAAEALQAELADESAG